MSNVMRVFLPYTLFVGLGVGIWLSHHRPDVEVVDAHLDATAMEQSGGLADDATAEPHTSSPAGKASRAIDPVCHMEVAPTWGFAARYQGVTYHFCTRLCRDQFAAAPEDYLRDRCIVCNKPVESQHALHVTYLGNTYLACSAEHRQDFKADPAAYFMHTMWGVPDWLYYVSIAIVLVVSFGFFELRDRLRSFGRRVPYWGSVGAAAAPAHAARWDLLQIGPVRTLLTSRVFRFAVQLVMVVLFFMIIFAGLFGNQNPALNVAPLLTWTVWWGGLVILIMYAGKAWCYMCPWDAVAGWLGKMRLWKKADQSMGLDLKWPRLFRNVVLATVLFIGLTWVELGFGVTMKPKVTAYLAIAMLLMAVVSAYLFERKGFCRYACLVGRVSGLYAMFAGIEVRSKDHDTCRSCRGKECANGTSTAYGCPTFLVPGSLRNNTYCIQCGECLQACPEDNLALNLRPWGTDLLALDRPRVDEAYLALLMLSITGFHGLTMTPNWQRLTEWGAGQWSLGQLSAFSLGMALLMICPIAVYAVLIGWSYWLGRARLMLKLSYHDYFIRYAYALLPIALFYHLAHNMEHLLMEGPKVVALLSDPCGWGWNLFGTAHWTIPPLISLDVLWIMQIALVLVGHVYSLWIAQRTSVQVFGDRRSAFRSQLPMLLGMVAFSVFSLWLLKQPMEMRSSTM